MRRFDNTRLWEAIMNIEGRSSILSSEYNLFLDEFIEELYAFCREEKNIGERTRSLNYARSELASFAESLTRESKKSISPRSVVRRAIYFIDSELEIVKMELSHPERFISFPDDHAPLARWNGSVAELLEYLIPIHIAGRVSKPSGEPLTYADFVKVTEYLFGISVKKPYDAKTKLLARKKNATPFIDKMRQLFREEAEKLDQ